ncbi:MAG: alanine racemase [Gammaproteobacteria bacterium]|nr:alanine racemase [Gammaproteobacteria bacterium]MDE0366229.1 alanine racemase [Gammaproteobacteria bacterium]
MPARLRVNRDALAANYLRYRTAVAGACGAVVKADGYGLGAEETAAVFERLGCRHFFVATAAEGLALRKVLQNSVIYVLDGVVPETARPLAGAGLVPVVNHERQLAAWAPFRDRDVAVHVDTGMNRLGFPVGVPASVFEGFQVSLLMTHLACADDPAHPLNEIQLRRFAEVAERFPGIATSIGNSAGSLLAERYHGDLARPGIGLYGGNPWLNEPNPARPVATLEAAVVQTREVAAGESVGYGATWSSRKARRLAVLGIGYADGLPRSLSNCGEAVVAGKRCPFVGRVSMDLTAIDVTGAQVEAGDWVELFGAELPVDEVARKAETIAYELLTGISPRVQRVYEG